ncbi:MAG: hypothetical protein IH862_08110 [Chloroflexi bacterium]|nr:hypothetical protein [Chloroflexota bacterium]
MLLLSVLAHHGEPGDPVLFEWIRHQIDSILGLGPGAIVIALGLVIVAIPLAIVIAFMAQRMRQRRS